MNYCMYTMENNRLYKKETAYPAVSFYRLNFENQDQTPQPPSKPMI